MKFVEETCEITNKTTDASVDFPKIIIVNKIKYKVK